MLSTMSPNRIKKLWLMSVKEKPYLAVPGRTRSTSLSPTENAFKVLPLLWGPGAVFTELGSCVTRISPFGGIEQSMWSVTSKKSTRDVYVYHIS